jgi:aerobic C4-dicarboxylate transport protein
MNVDATTLDVSAIANYTQAAKHLSLSDYLLHMVPSTVVGAFAEGEILQVLVFSLLFGFALAGLGKRGRPLVSLIDQVAHAMFGVVGLIMKVAPIGAFGAMAFTIGKFGLGTLVSLGKLMAGVYVTSALFVLVVLGLVLRFHGLSIWRFLNYLKEELLIVLGTSSSESVLPRLMAKLEALGIDRSVVGLTVPTGYSFNLDGTCIYLTMAAIFIAQATNTPLSLSQELTILFVLMLTSKGAATVTGGGFITLAATLASIGTPPVAGLVILVGVDRFMSEARALTNMVGNGVATVVVARWENAIDLDRARRVLAGEAVPELDSPAVEA